MRWLSLLPVRETRFAPVLLIITALAMLLGGGWVLNESLVSPLAEGWRMRNWEKTPAILDEIGLRAANGAVIPVLGGPGVDPALKEAAMPSGVVKLRVRYHYYVGEQSYEGQRYGLHLGLDDGDAQRHAAAYLYKKQEIPVWVNPENPAEAVMDRQLHWGVMLIAIPGLAVALVGALILGIALHTTWKTQQIARRMKALGRSA